MKQLDQTTTTSERDVKWATRTVGSLAVLGLLAVTACSSEGGDASSTSPVTAAPETSTATAATDASVDPTTTQPVETAPDTVATTLPATTEPAIDPTTDTIEVPFYVVDPTIPGVATCAEVIQGFHVSFTNGAGESTVVEALIDSPRVTDEVVNTTCMEGDYGGVPALYYTAVLDAPAAELYQSIELRYPYAFGAGSDRFETVFEGVGRVDVEAGIGVSGSDAGLVPLDPSEFANFPPAP